MSEQARIKMVDGQIRTNDVTHYRVIGAFLTTPRDVFVPKKYEALAYSDSDIPLNDTRQLMRVMPFARLVQAADLTADDVVLDIGSATGYSAAILSQLAGSVFALEEEADLAKKAEQNYADLNLSNVIAMEGELKQGLPSQAPFDVIFFEGAVEEIPQELFAQLGDGGRLLAIVAEDGLYRGKMYLREGQTITGKRLFDAAVPMLPGFLREKTFVF